MRDLDNLSVIRYPAPYRIVVLLFGLVWIFPLVKFFGTGPAPLLFSSLYFALLMFCMFAFWILSRKYWISDDEIVAQYPFLKARVFRLQDLSGWWVADPDEATISIYILNLKFGNRKLEIPLLGKKLKEALARLTADRYPRIVAAVEKHIESGEFPVTVKMLFGKKIYVFRKDGFSCSFRGKILELGWRDFRGATYHETPGNLISFPMIELITKANKKIRLSAYYLGGQGGVAEYVWKKLGT